MTDLYPTKHKDLYNVLKAFINRHNRYNPHRSVEGKNKVDLLEPQKYETMTIREDEDGDIKIEGTLGAGFTICKNGEVWVWNEREH